MNMDRPSERDPRLDLIAAGDQQALVDVFQECRSRLRRMVMLRMDRRLQGRVDPSDVLQEAYLDAARRASSMQRPTVRPWMGATTAPCRGR